MSIAYFSQTAIHEIEFLVDFFTSNIAQYKLSELTNGVCGDVVSINKVHPLSIEYGNMLNSDSNNYTSVLPAIGVEYIDDALGERQPLGTGEKTIEISQEFIDAVEAISMKDRVKNGILMSDTVLNSIKAMKLLVAPNELYGIQNTFMKNKNIVVSMWSNRYELTDILYFVIQSLVKRALRAIHQSGAKVLSMNSQRGLYNYDFSETLFGSEITLNILNSHLNVIVNSGITKFTDVEEYYQEVGKFGPEFVPLGG